MDFVHCVYFLHFELYITTILHKYIDIDAGMNYIKTNKWNGFHKQKVMLFFIFFKLERVPSNI